MYRHGSDHHRRHARPSPQQHHGAGTVHVNDERALPQIYSYSTSPYHHTDASYYQPTAPLPPQHSKQVVYGPPRSGVRQQAPSMAVDPQQQRSNNPRSVPSIYSNDPAFSTDPRANPLTHYTFAMNSREEIVPVTGGQVRRSSAFRLGSFYLSPSLVSPKLFLSHAHYYNSCIVYLSRMPLPPRTAILPQSTAPHLKDIPRKLPTTLLNPLTTRPRFITKVASLAAHPLITPITLTPHLVPPNTTAVLAMRKTRGSPTTQAYISHMTTLQHM